LYADVVHASGFPETVVGTITLPAIAGRSLAGDDAEGTALAVGETASVPERTASASSNGATATLQDKQSCTLPDGYTMVWVKPNAMVAKSPVDFQFQLLDPQGKQPHDMALYMGMLGHAAIVKTDGSTFAHIHPTGTVSMTAFMMANSQSGATGAIVNAGMNMPGMRGTDMGPAVLPNTVGFPYGFPSAGTYRIFVQMKHGERVETGIFDATVADPAS
jgi:hypothetical protein